MDANKLTAWFIAETRWEKLPAAVREKAGIISAIPHSQGADPGQKG